jgi:hypothetical protein
MTRSTLPSLTLTTPRGAAATAGHPGSGITAQKPGLLARLWQDDCGAMLMSEWLLIFVIVAIGCLVGWVAVRQGLIAQLVDTSHAILALDPSYGFTGQRVGCDVGHDGLWDGRDRRNGRVAEDGRTTRDGVVPATRDEVVEHGVRIGALEPGRDWDGTKDKDGVRRGPWYRGGTQAFVAGSSYISGRHFEGRDGLAAGSVAASTSTTNAKTCD